MGAGQGYARFIGLRPAEIGQHAIAQEFRQMATVAINATGHRILVSAHADDVGVGIVDPLAVRLQ